MKNLSKLKTAVCQMKVVPGRPDINAKYVISEIQKAASRGVDIIAFPEKCISGYLIGDLYEDECFVKDVQGWNEKICQATKGLNIIAIFGSFIADFDKKAEDGRVRLYNAAIVAQDGEMVDYSVKCLQPNYRMFDDDRHFYSARKIMGENNANILTQSSIDSFLKPIVVFTRIGKISLGVILCEDMWHMDYPYNPTKILVRQGAQIIFNLSCSPWTWQKNRKRNSVVKELLTECQVPFVYVNNTGIQNNGKNVVVFDGRSTIYREDGEIVFEVLPYESGSYDFVFQKKMKSVEILDSGDTAELYGALKCGGSGFLNTLPPQARKVYVGDSGGVDSAVDLALYVDILGSENVIAVNMPSVFNSDENKDLAKQIADNFGVEYLVRPIGKIVDAIAKQAGVTPDDFAYENIQARVRMEILAALAQKNNAVFCANGNKVELAFGYGTLYADIAGFFDLIGDLVKREVRQIAEYLNKEVFKKEMIPQRCIDQRPSAELKKDQFDPFDYGDTKKRGYHDEMVRAFTEFRRNPEWFLEMYLAGKLESALKLEKGHIAKLFPTSADFVADLEKNWRRFCGAYFKRVQAPPVLIVSKRAFGFDLRESMMSAYFTLKFYELKNLILK